MSGALGRCGEARCPTPHLAGTGWRTGWAPAPLLGGAPDPVILRGSGERLGFPVAARPKNGHDWTPDTWTRSLFRGYLRHSNYSRSRPGVGSLCHRDLFRTVSPAQLLCCPGQGKIIPTNNGCRWASKLAHRKDVSERAIWFLPWNPRGKTAALLCSSGPEEIKHDPHALPVRHVLAETPIDADAGAPPSTLNVVPESSSSWLPWPVHSSACRAKKNELNKNIPDGVNSGLRVGPDPTKCFPALGCRHRHRASLIRPLPLPTTTTIKMGIKPRIQGRRGMRPSSMR